MTFRLIRLPWPALPQVIVRPSRRYAYMAFGVVLALDWAQR